MFTVGLDVDTRAYFTAATMIIALPTGIKIFSWLATIYGGKPHYYTPFVLALVFIVLFTFGGFTGIILSNAAIDLALHDTFIYTSISFYVVATAAAKSSYGDYAHLAQLKQFWVGLMDGDGSIQVNHWRRKSLQFRLVIKLKNTEANYIMLTTLSKVVGGYVIKSSNFVIWVENDRDRIRNIFEIFNEYPPITTRLRSQLAFMKDCLHHLSVDRYLETRDNKYTGIYASKEASTRTTLLSLPYFSNWLSGFIEAEGCFSVRASNNHSFSISQKNDLFILEAIKLYFCLDNIIREPSPSFYLIEVYNRSKLDLVINHCNNYPLRGEKLISLKRFIAHMRI